MTDPPTRPLDDDGRGVRGHGQAPTGRTQAAFRAAFDWFFRDRRSGNIVVAHVPNLAISLWIVTVVVRQFVAPDTTVHTLLEWAGSITLGWWALDELVRGVNPFRRLLGLAGCVVVVAGVIARLQA